MKKILALGALTLGLLSCNPPPFDLAISLSARSASKMTLLGQIGPVNGMDSSSGNSEQTFYPELDAGGAVTLQAGFVTWVDQSGNQQLAGVVQSGSQYQQYGNSSPLGPAYAGQYPSFSVTPLKSYHNVAAFNFPANSLLLMTGNPGSGGLSVTTVGLNAQLTLDIGGGTYQVLGLGMYPDPGTTFDRSFWLALDSSSSTFYEVEYDLHQTSILWAATFRSFDLTSLLGASTRVLYYYDPVTTNAFASVYNAGSSSWQCVKWTENPPGVLSPQALPGITCPVTALLTTGQLLSVYQETGRLYDQNGALLAQFPLTGLRFIGEKYVNRVAQCLFSQALTYNHEVHFNVYSIPTANLKSLSQ